MGTSPIFSKAISKWWQVTCQTVPTKNLRDTWHIFAVVKDMSDPVWCRSLFFSCNGTHAFSPMTASCSREWWTYVDVSTELPQRLTEAFCLLIKVCGFPQCHKPAIFGNGLFCLYHLFMVIWGMVFHSVLPKLIMEVTCSLSWTLPVLCHELSR